MYAPSPSLSVECHSTVTKIENLVTELKEYYSDKTPLTSHETFLSRSPHNDSTTSTKLLVWCKFNAHDTPMKFVLRLALGQSLENIIA